MDFVKGTEDHRGVKVIAGDDKHKIGKVKQVDKFSNRVWVEDAKMGRMTKKVSEIQMDDEQLNKDKTGGWWMRHSLKAIHVSNPKM
ncbi:5697_t:CDS:2 [Acaulospora colombiana]|uniref:5697_t:CDS:1 n=1 Tax=Acaulospora colombiana TaxID=27376 RepID=A0ACA9KA17_9GLOM|nr:5697_t:CDS:2 [Acaulospora colombiana]